MPEDTRPPRELAETIANDATVTPSKALGFDPTATPTEAGAAPQRPSSGSLPARYHLGNRLGKGGMGEVLLASDQQIGRDVAIKRMLVSSSSLEQRFLREAKIQGRLEHPAIVPVHELATDSEGRPFFVMKRLTGITLADVLSRNTSRFSRQRLLRAFADVCLAIEFAHSRGIVHRDLKPANIMLGDFGEVYVLDWGIARVLDETEDHVASPVQASGPDATEVGTVLGTPGYMAPEQLHGLPLDGRADVFALGCILFEILVGDALLPRSFDALEDAFAMIIRRAMSRATDRDVPPELVTLCLDATQIEPDRRVQSARELGERVERYLDGDRDLAQRKSLAASHLTAARTALASGDGEVERATAMREAGRSIALDPTDGEAAGLVGRLMLEPPRAVPVEVEQHLAQIADITSRRRSLLVAFIAFGFLGFLPLLAWMGITDVGAVIAFSVAVLLNGAFALMIARRAKNASITELHIAVVFNVVVTTVLARMFTPFLVAPGIAAVSVMMFLADPRIRAAVVVPLTLVAVLGPWFLEVAGVLPATIGALGGDLVLHAPAVNVALPATPIALALYVTTLIALSGLVAQQLGASAQASLRAVEMQAWHLRQLVKT